MISISDVSVDDDEEEAYDEGDEGDDATVAARHVRRRSRLAEADLNK
jgi:hypothetical protein